MLLKLFKTVAIVMIFSVSTLLAQDNSTLQPQKWRNNKSIQSLNFYLPIESETWDVGSQKYEWSSLSFQFRWIRYKVDESMISTVFGLGAGYLTGELKEKFLKTNVDMGGLDFNIKFGLGAAPISNKLIIALHAILVADVKLVEGETTNENRTINKKGKYHPSAIYVNTMIGGDFIVGYQFFETIGVIAGVDITTKAFGIGAYSREPKKASKATQLHYVFSGLNIIPHLGVFFAF